MKTSWLCLLAVFLTLAARDTDGTPSKRFIDGNSANAAQGMSMDEIISNAANNASEFDFMYAPNPVDPKKSLIKIEHDIVLTMEEYEAMYNPENSSPEKRAAGIIDGAGGGHRWPNCHIPYQAAPGTFNSQSMAEIKGAMEDWSRYTCLTFGSAFSGNRMYFTNGGGCSSRVGMVGGAQPVTLAWGCRFRGVVTHEVGHAIGLHHEQTRPDRDDYVRINFRNIPPNIRYNFNKHGWNLIQNFNIPYDYLSIMHYGAYDFSMNNGLTIQTLDPKFQNVIGRRRRLSFLDIKTVNFMYKCREVKRCALKDSDCPGDGFVGPDCKCWCDGDPYTLCKTGGNPTGGKTQPPVTHRPVVGTTPKGTGTGDDKDCYDKYTHCGFWAKYNQCSANPSFMGAYCKKACNLCKTGTKTASTTTTRRPIVSSCRDLHALCPAWAGYGYCTSPSYVNFMSTNCQKACKLCTGTVDPITTKRPVVGKTNKCKDENTMCEQWAKRGDCDTTPLFMKKYCKKSCHVKDC